MRHNAGWIANRRESLDFPKATWIDPEAVKLDRERELPLRLYFAVYLLEYRRAQVIMARKLKAHGDQCVIPLRPVSDSNRY